MTSPGSPVFLTGYPKSGTTLLLSLLDGHPELNVFPKETLFFLFARPEIEVDREAGLDRFVERIFKEVLFGLEDVLDDDVGAERFKTELRNRWEAVDFAIPRFLDVAVQAYGDLIGRSGRRYWVEKTPHTELYAPTINRWYPDARFIHVIRDPRANYAAIRVWNEREDRPTGFPRFASHWKHSWRAVKRNQRRSPHLILKYEDLVQTTEASMREVCRFLEIEFDPNLLEPTLGGKTFQGNSMYKEKFQGVSDSSLERWRSVLSKGEVSEIDWQLRSEMEAMGYSVDTGTSVFIPSPRSILRWAVISIFGIYDRFPEAWKLFFRKTRYRLTGIGTP